MKTCSHNVVDGFFCEQCYVLRGGSLHSAADTAEVAAPTPDMVVVSWIDAIVQERVGATDTVMQRMEKRLRGLEQWVEGVDD